MGNRSQRRTPPNRQPEPSPRTPKPTTASTGSGACEGGESHSRECWDFTLLDLQTGAKQAESGTEVYGLTQGSRVLVANNKIGALGFAPQSTATKMIQATSDRDSELNGNVLSTSKTRDRITVRLCLT